MLKIEDIMNAAKTVKVPISNLKAAAYNPRKKLKKTDPEYEKILTSITTYGMLEDIVINSDMTIIGGHQRVQILKDMGVKELTCKQVNLDKNMERAANLMLNKADGVFVYDMVAESLIDLAKNNIDLDITGFTQQEFEALTAASGSGISDNAGDDDDKADESANIKMIYLSIGKNKIPISGEERDRFIDLVQEYIDEYDSPIGFVNWLLDQAK